MRLYRESQFEYVHTADRLSIMCFPDRLRQELASYLGPEEIFLLEAVTRVHVLGFSIARPERDKEIQKQLRQRGVRLSRGKRPNPILEELVDVVTPILMYFGVPLATGGSSKMTRILEAIAEGCLIQGDPRNELRRLKRKDEDLTAAWLGIGKKPH